MATFSPSTNDIRFNYTCLTDCRVEALNAGQFRALMLLVSAVAAGLVWTYSSPSDGSLPDDNKTLARLARVPKRQWINIRSVLEQFFIVADGKWHLNEEWIEIGGPSRTAIPLAIQKEIIARQGLICTYCGDDNGPFEIDHIFPVAKGGSNDPSNLTLACVDCNRSKRARTLREWMDA